MHNRAVHRTAAVLLFASLAFMLPSCANLTSTTGTGAAANPLLSASPLPLAYPQFDKIKDAHFAPAFRLGIRPRAAWHVFAGEIPALQRH